MVRVTIRLAASVRVKRESGWNPEQTRYCEFHMPNVDGIAEAMNRGEPLSAPGLLGRRHQRERVRIPAMLL